MATTATGQQLWEFCEDLYKKGAGYVWGAGGEVYTAETRDKLYKTYKSAKYNYAYYYGTQWALWKNKIVCDCSGMIQAFRNAHLDKQDDTANGLFTKCTKRGPINTLPKNLRGVLLFVDNNGTKNHVGVYGGDGYTIESLNSATGVTKRLLETKRWTHWGIPNWLQPDSMEDREIIFAGRVNASELNVRKGPSSKDYASIRVITKGTLVCAYEEKNGWYRISSSKDEWVKGSYITSLNSYTVTANSLNVRSGASTKFNPVSIIHKGDKVFEFSESGKWIKIHPEKDQWVSKGYLSKN